jgi:hypothetical protein
MADSAPESPKDDLEEKRARPTAPWRVVFAAFFLTFLVMLASIYWVIRTGKL